MRYSGLVKRAQDAPALANELLQPGMRVGLFGGSFNPVHEGHLHVARTAKERLQLDRVWWLVSPQNPLKSSDDMDLHWRRMAGVMTLAAEPGHVVSDVETRLESQYTIDLVRALQTRHPGVEFVWIMGADNLLGFHRWRGWKRLMETIPIAIIARPGSAIRARLGKTAQRWAKARMPQESAPALPGTPAPAWVYLTAPLHPHSSTAIRAQKRAAAARAAQRDR